MAFAVVQLHRREQHHNLSIFVFWLLAVREDSEQHNAHHGKAWHQVRAPEWATMKKTTEDTEDTGKSVKSDVNKVEKQ